MHTYHPQRILARRGLLAEQCRAMPSPRMAYETVCAELSVAGEVLMFGARLTTWWSRCAGSEASRLMYPSAQFRAANYTGLHAQQSGRLRLATLTIMDGSRPRHLGGETRWLGFGKAVNQVVRAGRQLSFQTDWRTLYQLGRHREMKSKVEDYTNHTPVFYKGLDRMRWLFHYLLNLAQGAQVGQPNLSGEKCGVRACGSTCQYFQLWSW